MRLEGKVAVVTGAGRGIGCAICKKLTQYGATVVGIARTAAQLDEIGKTIASSGQGKFHGITADVGIEADAIRVFGFVTETCGDLDILVNNAGSGGMSPITETSVEDWDRQMSVNARGMFLFTREAARLMVPRKSGWIVNISSIAGKRPAPGISAYVASKYAAVGFTEVAARELGKHGIRVISLCPGAVATDLRREAVPNEDTTQIMQPQDIAELVHFVLAGGGANLRDLNLEIFR